MLLEYLNRFHHPSLSCMLARYSPLLFLSSCNWLLPACEILGDNLRPLRLPSSVIGRQKKGRGGHLLSERSQKADTLTEERESKEISNIIDQFNLRFGLSSYSFSIGSRRRRRRKRCLCCCADYCEHYQCYIKRLF